MVACITRCVFSYLFWCSLQVLEQVLLVWRGAVMCRFCDGRETRDRSLGIAEAPLILLLMRMLVSDVNVAEDAELRRLEGLPVFGHASSVREARVSEPMADGMQISAEHG